MGIKAPVFVDFGVLQPEGQEFFLQEVQEVVFLFGRGSGVTLLVALGVDLHVAEELIQPLLGFFVHVCLRARPCPFSEVILDQPAGKSHRSGKGTARGAAMRDWKAARRKKALSLQFPGNAFSFDEARADPSLARQG